MTALTKYIPNKEAINRAIQEVTQSDKDRMVRRGKFFLAADDIERYGSLRRPIFQHWGHNITVAAEEYTIARDGYWCYATHVCFELIPDTTEPEDWPEYQRTPTGWEPVAEKSLLVVKPSIDLLKFDWSKAIGVQK